MKLIVGLGNPGKEYENTRHNIGFKVIDALSHKYNVELNENKFNGMFYKGNGMILAKPLTYMNLSGDFVQKLAHYYKIDIEDILVVYDDLDLATGVVRYRQKGSSGGQNGIKDIINKMGTQEIKRLKIGIGKPRNGAKNWVLGKFSPTQIQELDAVKGEIIARCEEFLEGKI